MVSCWGIFNYYLNSRIWSVLCLDKYVLENINKCLDLFGQSFLGLVYMRDWSAKPSRPPCHQAEASPVIERPELYKSLTERKTHFLNSTAVPQEVFSKEQALCRSPVRFCGQPVSGEFISQVQRRASV